MRIDARRNDHPQGSLRQGQIVRGRIVREGKQQHLLLNGKAVPVNVTGDVPSGTARFLVTVREGKVFLSRIPDPGHGGGETAGERKSVLARLVTRILPPAVRKGSVRGALPLRGLFRAVLPDGEADRAFALLKVYLEQSSGKKKDFNTLPKFSDTEKGEMRLLLEALVASLPPSVPPVGGGAGGGGNPQSDRDTDGGEFCFMLLPVSRPGGRTDLVPLLMVGDAGGRNRSWIFSECMLERTGPVRIVLFGRSGYYGGEVFCGSEAVPLLSDLIKDPNIAVRGGGPNGDFGTWPLEVIADGRAGGFNGRV